jgi:hypothetical protein
MKSIIKIRRSESSFSFEGIEEKKTAMKGHPGGHPKGKTHPSEMPRFEKKF